MAPPSGSTAHLHFNVIGRSSEPYQEDRTPMLVQRANDAVNSAIAHGKNLPSEENALGPNAKTAIRTAFIGQKQNDTRFSQLLNFPPPPESRSPKVTLHALQEWEGYVVDIGETDFVARLIDLTAGSERENEEATIPLAEISDRDAERIREGSIFRWVIGYERSVTGARKRVSQIVFRDLPAVTEADLRDAQAWADDTARAFAP